MADQSKRNGSTARDKVDRDNLRRACEPVDEPCHICWTTIDYLAGKDDDNSFSLDHILPIKRYPELRHVPTNHQPAHLGCNRHKGERDQELPVGVTSETW